MRGRTVCLRRGNLPDFCGLSSKKQRCRHNGQVALWVRIGFFSRGVSRRCVKKRPYAPTEARYQA